MVCDLENLQNSYSELPNPNVRNRQFLFVKFREMNRASGIFLNKNETNYDLDTDFSSPHVWLTSGGETKRILKSIEMNLYVLLVVMFQKN